MMFLESARVMFVVWIFWINLPLSTLVQLDLIECGVDNEDKVFQGKVDIEVYPWLGILYYMYYGDGAETRSVTQVVLIHKEFVVAPAADIGPMPKKDFRKNSRVLLGETWNARGRRVRNYVLHPEYGDTINTLALIQLKDMIRTKEIRPLCAPPDLLRDPIFYVVKFKSDYNELQKEVIPVSHVPSNLCREFYILTNLYSRRHRPVTATCAVALDEDAPCVWEAGAALVARDVWGRWLFLGLGVRGPGCGAPSRYLDMGTYYPWIKHSLSQFNQITISKITNQKYVLRSGSISKQRFGNCDEEEQLNLIYRDLILLHTDNTQYQFLTYNMTIHGNVEYHCLTLELINASASSEMRIGHLCPQKVDGSPCHYYKSSRFDISVYIMFSDKCRFEMVAWGEFKDMTLLEKQEWKWEEGTYYEDFSLTYNEYRGQTYMTEFGFEPLDEAIWVPEYDLWTTTPPPAPNITTVRPPHVAPPAYWYPEYGWHYSGTVGTQPTTTTSRTKRYFKVKSTFTTRTTTTTTTPKPG